MGERCAASGTGAYCEPTPDEPRDSGADLVDVVGVGANLHIGDAGDYRGDVDGHEQVIRAGVAFVEDIGAADVRARGSANSSSASASIAARWRSKVWRGLSVATRNLTPNPFPSGKGNWILGGRANSSSNKGRRGIFALNEQLEASGAN